MGTIARKLPGRRLIAAEEDCGYRWAFPFGAVAGVKTEKTGKCRSY